MQLAPIEQEVRRMPKINRTDRFHAHKTRSYYRHEDGSISSSLKRTAVWRSHCYCHGNYVQRGNQNAGRHILIYILPQLIDDFHGSDLQTSHHALSSYIGTCRGTHFLYHRRLGISTIDHKKNHAYPHHQQKQTDTGFVLCSRKFNVFNESAN
jgi:hypothetical protein